MAAKRPKNSALEVDLDFEHNRGRPPIISEENNDIIEDVILKRIREVLGFCEFSFFFLKIGSLQMKSDCFLLAVMSMSLYTR